MSQVTYTQDQLDIAILKNNQSLLVKTLERLEHKVDSHFHWTLGLLFGVYAIGISSLLSAVGKAYGWF